MIGAIIAAQLHPAADDEAGALEEPVDELLEPAIDGAAAADQPAAVAAPGKHQAIVWKAAESKVRATCRRVTHNVASTFYSCGPLDSGRQQQRSHNS